MTEVVLKKNMLKLASLAVVSAVSALHTAAGASLPPPAAPSHLLAKGGNDLVALSWTASPDAITYDVYAATSRGGEGSHAVEVGIAGTKTTVPGLIGGRRYYFEVRAVRGRQLSAPSNEVSAVPTGSLGVAYVLNDTGSQIKPFLIQNDGSLTAVGAAPVSNVQRPQWIATTPNGRFTYVINGNYVGGQFALSQFSVGLDGSLTPLSVPYVYLGNVAPDQLVVDRSGRYVYLVAYSGGGEILQFDIGTDGALTLSTNPPVATTGTFGSMAATRSALYVPGFDDNTIQPYGIGSGGLLAPLDGGSRTAGQEPIAVTLDPSGTHLYVVNYGYYSQGTISQYNINRDGSLTPMLTPSVTVGYGTKQLVITPSGKFAYAANFCPGPNSYCGSGSISILTFDASGALQPVSTLDNVPYNRYLAVDPTSQYVYMGDGYGNLERYNINADGTLTNSGYSVSIGDPEHILIPGGSAE